MFTNDSCLDRFQKDERGVIAIVFALVAFILVLITGLAIDVGRTVHANRKIASALDAAALAAAKGMRLENLNDGQVQALAKKFFETNMASSGGNYAIMKPLKVTIDRAKGAVELDIDAHVPTLFGGLAGVEKIELPKGAAAIFDAKDVEVAVQLDVTGSMGGRRIRDLKTATNDLLDVLIPDEPTGQKVRVGFAPYAAGINAGALASSVNGGQALAGNCVYERKTTSAQYTDDLPIGLDALMTKAEAMVMQPGKSVRNCPGAEILPMTDDKVALSSTVNGYRTGGSTAGHLGTAWAWYLLSPKWAGILPSSARPAPYNDGKTLKVAIVMTDGIFNTINGVHFGDNSPEGIQSGDDAIKLCEGMRNAGIVVYTVGFELGSKAEPTRVMRECASNPGNFFKAESGDALRLAFRSIAEQIVTLRLSK